MSPFFRGAIIVALSCLSCHTADQTYQTASVSDPPPPTSAPGYVGQVGSIQGSACPNDMVEINGSYCSNVEEICLFNVDSHGIALPGPGNTEFACGEFKYPTRCLSAKTTPMHFCIDRYEWPNRVGQVPQDWMTWYDAKKAVEAVGKRLCTSREWTLAAEGTSMHPLPYGDGYHRDSSACNFDRHANGINVQQAKTPTSPMSEILRSLLVPSGSMPRCVSDYGVYDLAGNIDEFVVNESGHPYCSGMKGGHIWHVRNASRPMTIAHGPTFSWYESGTRACKDIP